MFDLILILLFFNAHWTVSDMKGALQIKYIIITMNKLMFWIIDILEIWIIICLYV